jgi:leucyl/phenylalanyl-tRNA---protein transferase
MDSIPIARMLQAYCEGYFPMSDSAQATDFSWYMPHRRGIIPLDQFHVSKNVLRAMRNRPHEVRYNAAFAGVMAGCADRPSTWISPLICTTYEALYRNGWAHSVEIWIDNELVGGLYGVAIGRAFFGESMFHFAPDADKFALYYCHQRLVQRGFQLWDTQFYTPHLGTMGAIEISKKNYLQQLKAALDFTNPPQFAP